MIDESYILPADGCEAGTYTFRDRHIRIIGVEECLLCITPMDTPAYPLHLSHTMDGEDSGKGLFESTSEVAPFDEGDRIGVVKFLVYADTPKRRTSTNFSSGAGLIVQMGA